MVSFVEIGPVDLEKGVLFISSMNMYFRYYLPLEKGLVPSFEQTALCIVWLKLAQYMVLEKNIFDISSFHVPDFHWEKAWPFI